MEKESIKASEIILCLKKLETTNFMEKELTVLKQIRDLRIALEKVDEDFIDEISKGEVIRGKPFRGNEAYDILLHLENLLEDRIEDSILKLH